MAERGLIPGWSGCPLLIGSAQTIVAYMQINYKYKIIASYHKYKI